MKLRSLSLFIVLLTALVTSLSASADVKSLPIVNLRGQQYHYYTVNPKETVYTLCRELGISKEEMLKHNPSVADGLKAGMTLYFPIEVRTLEDEARKQVVDISHTVEKGETIYGLAHKYGVTKEDILEQNPFIYDGLKAGQVLKIRVKGNESSPAADTAKTPASASAPTTSPASAASPAAPSPSPSPIVPEGSYLVKAHETFYSIARAHGLTVAELEAANPQVTVLQEGQIINIPKPSANEPDSPSAPSLASEPSTPVQPAVETPDAEKSSEIRVALVLPFMLNEQEVSKNAKRFTEFYKGFLVAVDSLRNNGTPIIISAYDTEGSTDKVKEIISKPELAKNDIIIAPDNAAHVALLANFARKNDIKVLNNFVVRDESYLTNPSVIQGNIPSDKMLDKAVNAVYERVRFTIPVFLTLAGGSIDKADFVDALKKKLDDKGVAYKTIKVNESLTPEDLKSLSTGESYSFITATGRQAEVNKLLPAIAQWRDAAITPSVKVMGYPEWVTFRGTTLENMHSLNTMVYSRFYSDSNNYGARNIADKFKSWYGRSPENAIPQQALLGFDTGMFVINYIKNDRLKHQGVQNGFNLTEGTPTQGQVNELLYLLTYRPGELIEKVEL